MFKPSLSSMSGSIYTLMIVAARGILPGFLMLDTKSVKTLCNEIRNPNPSKFLLECPRRPLKLIRGLGTETGKHIINYLIPAVARLRQVLPVTFSAIFPSNTLRKLGFAEEIPCSDFTVSDRFFNYIKKK
jgi:hypothetical protein